MFWCVFLHYNAVFFLWLKGGSHSIGHTKRSGTVELLWKWGEGEGEGRAD